MIASQRDLSMVASLDDLYSCFLCFSHCSGCSWSFSCCSCCSHSFCSCSRYFYCLSISRLLWLLWLLLLLLLLLLLFLLLFLLSLSSLRLWLWLLVVAGWLSLVDNVVHTLGDGHCLFFLLRCHGFLFTPFAGLLCRSVDAFKAWWGFWQTFLVLRWSCGIYNFGRCTSCWTQNGNLLSGGLTIVSLLNATTHQNSHGHQTHPMFLTQNSISTIILGPVEISRFCTFSWPDFV